MMNGSTDTPISFDEALDKTGNGLYNILLASECALLLIAVGIDLLGFSLVVEAACDLDLTVTQKGILTSLPFIGILLVSYIWGYISDTRGRRFSLVISMRAAFVFSSLCSICPNWIVLGVFKFISVCFSCAANSATYTLVGESCISRVRNKYMLLMTSFLILSPAIAAVLTLCTLRLRFAVDIPGLGINFTPWRLLIIVMSLPTGIGAIGIYFFHESPKFLANSGRREEALKVMKAIHAANHRHSKDEFKVHSLLKESTKKEQQGVIRALYEQSAPLFRKPYMWRTLQLFYIVAVVYITNNTFLVWLPHILSLITRTMSMKMVDSPGNICTLISLEQKQMNQIANYTDALSSKISPETCVGTVEDNVVFIQIASQFIFAFLNCIISYLPNHRRKVLISILCLSTLSGICINIIPEPISSVVFFVIFTCTCLGLGILASYFVDLYPTSHRSMVAFLSVMVGRTCAFVGINLVANLMSHHCEVTFYVWSVLVFSSVIAAWYLPADKPVNVAA